MTDNPRTSGAGLKFFRYGSRLYGTHSEISDHDCIAIGPFLDEHNGKEHRFGDVNIHLYTNKHFQKLLADHDVMALEVYSQAPDEFEFNLDLSMLRRQISAKSSHSFVKAAKKIDVERELYIGQKSLFHSLRILMFGMQVAKSGYITDFSEANIYWHEILALGDIPWVGYKVKYQPIYNGLATAFRKLAPKGES